MNRGRTSFSQALLLAALLACGSDSEKGPVVPQAAAPGPTPVGEAPPPMTTEGAVDLPVVLGSGGWQLAGEWRLPRSEEPVPAVLLLHRAAGTRHEYRELAAALTRRGVASLRLDLRAHGESVNLGRFEEPFAEKRALLEGTHEDVEVALRWIESRPDVAGDRVAAVGASYSGEAIGEALRAGGAAATAYVMLSPGSFSDASITAVDGSGASWLFVRTSDEDEVSRPYIDAVFDALVAGSRSAEIRVIPGSGHATRIFDEHPAVVDEIADWLAGRLASETGDSG